MAEVLYQNLEAIQSSDILDRLGLEPGKYMLLSAHRRRIIDTEKNFRSLFTELTNWRKVRHADSILLSSTFQETAGGVRI